MKKVFLFAVTMITVTFSQAQWQPDVRLTNNPSSSFPSCNSNAKVIAASGDTLHVVWFDARDGNNEIYYKRSTDKGLSWGADVRLTNSAGISANPCVAVSGSVIHVMWSDYRTGDQGGIYYKRSEDGGSTWGADTRLTDPNSDSDCPAMTIQGSVIHVVWDDLRNATGPWDYEEYYKRSTDGGLSWGPDTRLTYNPSYSGLPGVVVSGSVVHIVWEDDRDGHGEVYYKQSTDGGTTWGADTRLTNNTTDSWDPCIALNDSVIHIVWMEMINGAYEIYYKRSTDGGITWGPDTRLTNATGDSRYPTIAISGSMLHIVWQDMRDGTYEIYYKQSVDAGLSWGEDTKLTNAPVDAELAFIALSDSVVHVVWNDWRDGNGEIYYKRNPTGNVPVGIGNDFAGNSGQQIIIWPNPASDKVNVSLTNVQNGKIFASVYDVLGEKVLFQELPNAEMRIDVSGLQNGLYFVSVTLDKWQSTSKKLIISK